MYYISNQLETSTVLSNMLFTSVRKAHRGNKIVVVLKLLPSRAFPLDGKSAGPLNIFIYSKRESSSFNLLPLRVYLCKPLWKALP